MITIPGSPIRWCDGLSRREFLQIGGLGAAGLALPDLFRARASGATPPAPGAGRAKVVHPALHGRRPAADGHVRFEARRPGGGARRVPAHRHQRARHADQLAVARPGGAGPPLRDHPHGERRVHRRRPRPERLPGAHRPQEPARQRRRHSARRRRLSVHGVGGGPAARRRRRRCRVTSGSSTCTAGRSPARGAASSDRPTILSASSRTRTDPTSGSRR